MMATKTDIKGLIEELFQLYVTIPANMSYKKHLATVISDVKNNIPLRNILLNIQSKIESTKNPQHQSATKRESDTKFWEYVLKIFVSRLPTKK